MWEEEAFNNCAIASEKRKVSRAKTELENNKISEVLKYNLWIFAVSFFTTKEVGVGTGQGLAIAHNVIVKSHEGQIWFDSKEGVGTTFYIKLPMIQSRME